VGGKEARKIKKKQSKTLFVGVGCAAGFPEPAGRIGFHDPMEKRSNYTKGPPQRK